MSYDLDLVPRTRQPEFLADLKEPLDDDVAINPGPVVPEKEAWEARSDFDEVLAKYLRVSTRLPEIIAQSNPVKKPWWKFW